DPAQLDAAFELIQGSTKNGGLLVVRNGWLVYERYFGLGHREATPNLASCGKSFTSIAVGILMAERPELFPDGLDQKIFTPRYFPAEAFPLSDPRKADIKLGQLLTFTSGIRGNNPCFVQGREINIDPAGPDGWQSGSDAVALGHQDVEGPGGVRWSTAQLWCEPGGGYSYATSSIHLAAIMLRHVTDQTLNEYLDDHLGKPLGWGRWGFGYRGAGQLRHMSGGGGIALRATDMLRFGYLLLHGGRWNDRQLIPADYVRHCSQKSPYNPHFPYSLQFNVNTDGDIAGLPRDAFWKGGSGAHCLYVVPSLDLVVWKLGGRDEQYSPANIGLPASPASQEQVAARRGWKETVDAQTALRQTLQRVIGSIVADAKPANASERANQPGQASRAEEMRQPSVARKHLPGQLVVHPQNSARFGRVGANGRIEDIMLCGLGSPEGFLYLPREQQDHILGQVQEHGGNMLYTIAVRSHGGDGGPKENPFIDHDPAKGLDETILSAWARIFR
ncbi:MAG: serine hydrolase domain-containing protein, partial [Opitutaceae bacterium]